MSPDDEPCPSSGVPRPADSRPHQLGSPHLNDHEAYQLLIRLEQTAHHHAPRCWSTAAATALAAAAHTLRALASALYRANIRDHIDRGDQI